MPLRRVTQLPDPPGGAQFYVWGADLTRFPEARPHGPGGLIWLPDAPPPPSLAPCPLGTTVFSWERPYLMGVLNVTPDSFSDGGQFFAQSQALTQAQALLAAGVDLIDIGGESSRPGAAPVSVEEELSRVLPVIQELRAQSTIPISVDTTKPEVAQAALAVGADLINDISAGADPTMFPLLAGYTCPIVLMHMQGQPRTMQLQPHYDEVVDEVYEFFLERIQAAQAAGIARERLWLDPGIGFGKTVAHNLTLLRRLGEFQSLGCPLLIGTSRKRFIGTILYQPDPQARLWGTAATVALSIAQGAQVIRVHDVQAMREVAQMTQAVLGSAHVLD